MSRIKKEYRWKWMVDGYMEGWMLNGENAVSSELGRLKVVSLALQTCSAEQCRELQASHVEKHLKFWDQ